MPTVTQNYGIKKPFIDDRYDLTTINENADIIDASIKNVDNRISNIIAQSGTSDTEVIDARGGFITLKNRLDNNDVQVNTSKVKATNLVTNGDFSNGTTGWTSSNATFAIVGGELEITSTSATSDIRAFQTTNLRPNLNAKLYVEYKGRLNFSGSSRIRFLLRDGVSGNVINENIVSNPTQNQQYSYSAIITNGFTLLNDLYMALDYRSVNIGNKGYFDEALVINLTAIFGAGKEPTKEQMDWLLAQKFTNSWFNGTAELTSILDLLTLVNTKANITQEAWITATLLNGWTGTIRYAKNQMGFVTVDFDLIVGTGTVNTNFSSLPIGYRPLKFKADNLFNVSTFGLRPIVITDGGFIQLLQTTTTGQILKGVLSYYVGN